MSQSTKLPSYRSQLLRMWVEYTAADTPIWRFSLEEIGSGKRSGFADLDALICCLLEMMEETAPPHTTQDAPCPPP
ncbi:MAG: hypothetical protein R3C14_43345 [Caldilineaceae bacterium]